MQQYPRNPRATLWMLAYQGISVQTHLSIVREMMAWPNLSHFVKAGDANIDRARSKVASWYLQNPQENPGDVLLMVDSDNAWAQGDLAFIAKRALERVAVVGGIYPKRAFGAGPALRVAREAEGVFKIGEEQLLPAEFVGTGFIAIPRVILEKVGESLPTVKGDFKPFFMPFVIGDEYPTDDWAFCARVREAGFGVYACTLPNLTHEGTHQFRLVDAHSHPLPDKAMSYTFTRQEEPVHA